MNLLQLSAVAPLSPDPEGDREPEADFISISISSESSESPRSKSNRSSPSLASLSDSLDEESSENSSLYLSPSSMSAESDSCRDLSVSSPDNLSRRVVELCMEDSNALSDVNGAKSTQFCFLGEQQI